MVSYRNPLVIPNSQLPVRQPSALERYLAGIYGATAAQEMAKNAKDIDVLTQLQSFGNLLSNPTTWFNVVAVIVGVLFVVIGAGAIARKSA